MAGTRLHLYVRIQPAWQPRPALEGPADVGKVLLEKVSTRPATRSELDAAVTLARDARASNIAVTLVAHEHTRLGRSIHLAMLDEDPLSRSRLDAVSRPGMRSIHVGSSARSAKPCRRSTAAAALQGGARLRRPTHIRVTVTV